MRILLIGSNGQVGHELALLSQNSKHEWLCLDRGGLDVTQPESVNLVVDNFAPNVVINATAYTSVDKAEFEKELAEAVNVKAPRYLAQACERNKATLMHISTDYVFNGEGVEPFKEEDSVAPSCNYGATKLSGELEVSMHCRKHIILRTSWVFGQHGNNFVKTMIRIAQGCKTLRVVSDQYGSPTSANGIANTLLNIVEQIGDGKEDWGTYHYSGIPYISWYDFAKLIFNEGEKRRILAQSITVDSITTAEYPTSVNRPANSRLDCKKIQSTFGISPDDWRVQLGHMLDSFKQD